MNKGQLVTRYIKHLADSADIKGSIFNKHCNGLIGYRFEMPNDFIYPSVNTNFKDDTTVKEKINEEVLCVLRKNRLTNQIEVDYVKIENPFSKIIDNFSTLCDNPNSSLQEIINFIKKTEELNQLSTLYHYCVYLNGSYQAFNANNQDTLVAINNMQQLIMLNFKNDPEKYDRNKAISDYKNELKAKYILWSKAYSINKTYRFCYEDKSILTFSHRIDGWSNPIYQLTTNFSVEIKTNFGYGRASYFYTKLKYKDIEITPFSEWIDYEFAKFSEIVRYTQSHFLHNEYWLDAIEYSRDACNLSMTDEIKFIEKYVIDECEKMVKGLEEIFNKEHFSFKNREKKQYTIDKTGHVLIEFRGEKISGALDFISKILEFEKIASIQSFINRIEVCNKRIHPILVDESKILKVKISNLTEEKNALKPQYDKLIAENNIYVKKRIELQRQLVSNGQLDIKQINISILDKEFSNKYPEYEDFKKEYDNVTESFRLLIMQIQNLSKVYDNVLSYNKKIEKYFEK